MASAARQLLINSQVSILWPVSRRRHPIARARETVRRWRLRLQQRAELARLDRRERRDIGATEADVHTELAKWFWQE